MFVSTVMTILKYINFFKLHVGDGVLFVGQQEVLKC